MTKSRNLAVCSLPPQVLGSCIAGGDNLKFLYSLQTPTRTLSTALSIEIREGESGKRPCIR